MDFHFKKSSGLSLEQAFSLEWLETNGLGGYASSSIINGHTRKYHGLLVSKLSTLPDKYVMLSKVEDIIQCNGETYYLTAHNYPDFLQDGSFPFFKEFTQSSHPTFTYQFADFQVVKEIVLLSGENTVLLKYKIIGATAGVKIILRPLIAARNFHALAKVNSDINTVTVPCNNGVLYQPYSSMSPLYLQVDSAHVFKAEPLWYNNFVYTKEQERGYPYTEDLFAPGAFSLDLECDGKQKEIIFSCALTEQHDNLQERFKHEIAVRTKNNSRLVGTPLQKQLKKVADSFIEHDVKLEPQGVVAGYHWFLSWGRDTMISLPGLTLYSGKDTVCLEILKNFAANEKAGLIPNFLGATPEQNAYNSVDASLWFVWAVQQYYAKTGDTKGIALYLWPTIKNIYSNFKSGTVHNIKMQENGLLFAGSKEDNVTWMDAMINGAPVTPRYGLQVEVNALWYNMLCFMQELSSAMLDSIKRELQPIIKLIAKEFVATFWNPEIGYLYDYVNAEEKNSALRPNQIFAISLPYSVVPKKIATKIMAVVKEHLLTPYGLRTLSPKDKNYCGIYRGNQEQRDRAYHNGCVWPWLIGHYGEALLRTSDRRKTIKELKPIFAVLTSTLAEAGIGSISEIFSGDALHLPDGCISQAWNIAELLRLSYLLGID